MPQHISCLTLGAGTHCISLSRAVMKSKELQQSTQHSSTHPACSQTLLRQSPPLTASILRKFLQFRMGSHGLPGLTGGWAGISRDARVCPLCQSHYPDEQHAMLECRALQTLRDEFGCLFQHPMSMRQFMWQPTTVRLAKYVVACMWKLNTGTDA